MSIIVLPILGSVSLSKGQKSPRGLEQTEWARIKSYFQKRMKIRGGTMVKKLVGLKAPKFLDCSSPLPLYR